MCKCTVNGTLFCSTTWVLIIKHSSTVRCDCHHSVRLSSWQNNRPRLYNLFIRSKYQYDYSWKVGKQTLKTNL